MRASTAPIVKTSVFEGPLDLLIGLVEERKLLINDISLAAVTDEYVAKISAMGELPLNEASEFVALAATLLLIKSRSLLPSLSLTEEETSDIAELEYRLALYQIIREGARHLYSSLDNMPALWEGVLPEFEPIFVPGNGVALGALFEASRRLTVEFPKQPGLPSVSVRKAVSLEATIDRLAQLISANPNVSFRDFSDTSDSESAKSEGGNNNTSSGNSRKYEIVVSFLALLELVKRGIIKATQNEYHGDIVIEQDAVLTPSY